MYTCFLFIDRMEKRSRKLYEVGLWTGVLIGTIAATTICLCLFAGESRKRNTLDARLDSISSTLVDVVHTHKPNAGSSMRYDRQLTLTGGGK